MVKLFVVFLSLLVSSASASPTLFKRIAQTIADSTTKWEQACLAAGGGQQCNPLSVAAFGTLLAAAGPCDQQDAADGLMNLSKQLESSQMIALAQIFAQQPRNSPNSVAIPYCQKAPQNPELNGLFQCQFVGSNQKLFVGNVAVGGPGTIPFGHNTPLNPLGSCAANPSGPIADGTQLSDLTTNPGVSGGAASSPEPVTQSTFTSNASTATPPATVVATSPAAAAPMATSSAGDNGNFHLANGQAAQKLNAQFASLTDSSPCKDGEDACVGDAFAQCVDGKFVTQSCGAEPLTCVALPLVNSPGTSVTCSTTADAEARIMATGATGGLTGSGSPPSASETVEVDMSSSAADAAAVPSVPESSNSLNFKIQNGREAQALNAKFAGLSIDSACIVGENACVKGGFAQCVNGKFVATQCSSTLSCFALPLVNSPGTSITCTTPADALARIQATGATGDVTGA